MTTRFRHFAAFQNQKLIMQPVINPRTFCTFSFIKTAFRLRNFISMMNRHMVNTTSMDIKMLAQIFHTHSRTLNMPARITTSPWRIPSHSLIFKFRFSKPKNKVTRITLVLVHNNNITLTSTGFKFIKIQIRKFTIIWKS